MIASLVSPRSIVIIIITSLLLAIGGGYSLTSAQDKRDLCRGANLTFSERGEHGNINCGTNASGRTTNNQDSLNNLVASIVNIFSIIVGIVAVIMIIVGGFKFITSGGDSGKVTSSRNTIIYAIVGLIIVALAQIIVKFVLARVPN